jgi:cytochrome b561
VDTWAPWSGWAALLVVVAAGLVPLLARVARKRRAELHSRPLRLHVSIGIAAAAAAALHTLLALPALGSAAAIGGGGAALAPGAVAFFVVVAHVGIGLQLRDPKLRTRAKKRAIHLTTAISIVALAVVHAVLLRCG